MPALDAVRAPERLPHATDERRSLLVPCRPERQHDELVPADPGDGVRRAHDRLEPARDGAQHLVARLVTAHVVDPLEAVEVDDEEGERLLRATRSGERLLDTVVEERAIRQPGERVTQGESMRRLDLAPQEQRRQPGPERQGEPDGKRRAQPLLPDELEARR